MKQGIEPLEFDARISGGKAPIDGDRLLIATVLPSLDLLIQLFSRPNAAREALARQGGEFNLGHIQPTAMHWGVMDFQLPQDTVCFS